MNPHARALGRLGKGKKKTMTPEAIAQRKAAAQKRTKALPMPTSDKSTSYTQLYKLPVADII